MLSSVRHRKLKELVLDLDLALTLPPDQRVVIKDALHRLRAGPRRKGRKVRGEIYAMVVRVPGGRRHYRLVYEVIESERLVLVC